LLDNALPRDDNADAEVEVGGRPGAGIFPERLPRNGEWLRDTAMTELPKMPCEMLSRHLQEALS
jgi:hypothetical protein